MTATTTRTRRIATRIASAGAALAAAGAFALAGAGSASALAATSASLTPGNGVCTPSQYAVLAVRGDATASLDGAKFKVLRNGVVIANTPTRVNSYAVQLSGPNFPGAGYYSLCAQNTGTRSTLVSMTLRTDAEV